MNTCGRAKDESKATEPWAPKAPHMHVISTPARPLSPPPLSYPQQLMSLPSDWDMRAPVHRLSSARATPHTSARTATTHRLPVILPSSFPCRLLHLALPLVLQNIAGYTLSVVAAAFIGHLNDPVSLSAAVLAGSFYNISGYSLVIGLSAGMETLCGQVGAATTLTPSRRG